MASRHVDIFPVAMLVHGTDGVFRLHEGARRPKVYDYDVLLLSRDPLQFHVKSGRSGNLYRVTFGDRGVYCNCQGNMIHTKDCVHITGVQVLITFSMPLE